MAFDSYQDGICIAGRGGVDSELSRKRPTRVCILVKTVSRRPSPISVRFKAALKQVNGGKREKPVFGSSHMVYGKTESDPFSYKYYSCTQKVSK